MNEINLKTIWYAAGQLDGDGCVFGTHNGERLRVCMDKAELGKASLEWFHQIFGGNFSKSRDAVDKNQAVYAWTINCNLAVTFCQLIWKFTQLKQEQFRKASLFPIQNLRGRIITVTSGTGVSITFDSIDAMSQNENFRMKKETIKKWIDADKYPRSLKEKTWKLNMINKDQVHNRQRQISARLKEMKSMPHGEIAVKLPAPYFAGLFDAEGDVSVVGFNGITLTFTQKYRAACDAFAKRYGGCVTKCGGWHWTLCKREEVKRFVDDILPYIVEKKSQLDLVMRMRVNGAQAIKDQLTAMKGNQGKKAQKPTIVTQSARRSLGLPNYISTLRNSKKKVNGYRVHYKNHDRNFRAGEGTLEEALNKAKAYLHPLLEADFPKLEKYVEQDMDEQIANKITDYQNHLQEMSAKVKRERPSDLPKYIGEVHRNNVLKGYSVQYKGNKKKYADTQKGLSKNLEEAKQHLAQLIAANQPPIAS